MEKLAVQPNIAESVDVIRNVGAWMRENNIANYSDWWNPENVSEEMLGQYAQPDEFFVVEIDGHPAATAIIQAEQSLQDWSSIDQDNKPPKATYIHYVAVERAFAGRGLVGTLIDKAAEVAQEQGSSLLRLDTNAKEPKLCALYESLGFAQVGTEQKDGHVTAFYEKPVAKV